MLLQQANLPITIKPTCRIPGPAHQPGVILSESLPSLDDFVPKQSELAWNLHMYRFMRNEFTDTATLDSTVTVHGRPDADCGMPNSTTADLHSEFRIARAASDFRNERFIMIDCQLLNSREGCGLMLAGIPRYRSDNAFSKVMRRYDCPDIFADKRAARVLDDNENLMGRFTRQVDEFKLNLKANFRMTYAECGIYLAVDPGQSTAYFLAEPEHYLALANYYRNALPGITRALGITLRGSTGRLTPAGWHNLLNLCATSDFRYRCPPVKHVEVMAITTTAEWRAPSLYLGVSLLNLSDVGTVIEKALDAVTTSETVTAQPAKSAAFWRELLARQDTCPQIAV